MLGLSTQTWKHWPKQTWAMFEQQLLANRMFRLHCYQSLPLIRQNGLLDVNDSLAGKHSLLYKDCEFATPMTASFNIKTSSSLAVAPRSRLLPVTPGLGAAALQTRLPLNYSPRDLLSSWSSNLCRTVASYIEGSQSISNRNHGWQRVS